MKVRLIASEARRTLNLFFGLLCFFSQRMKKGTRGCVISGARASDLPRVVEAAEITEHGGAFEPNDVVPLVACQRLVESIRLPQRPPEAELCAGHARIKPDCHTELIDGLVVQTEVRQLPSERVMR